MCEGTEAQVARGRIFDGEGQTASGIYKRFCTALDLLDAGQSDATLARKETMDLVAWKNAAYRHC